jgi:hypothetical protein
VRNLSGRSCRENQNSHFEFNNIIPLQNRATYEIMWKNIAQREMP